MADDVSNVETVLWVVLEHHSHEIHEVFREEAFGLELSMGEPESGASIVTDQFVEVIFFVGPPHEGRATTDHDEEDDSSCKEIDVRSVVVFALEDLGRHVTWSANIARVEASAITTLKRAAETKVNKFDVEVVIEQNVFGFKVPVGEALRVQVADGAQNVPLGGTDAPAHDVRPLWGVFPRAQSNDGSVPIR